MLVKVNESES